MVDMYIIDLDTHLKVQHSFQLNENESSSSISQCLIALPTASVMERRGPSLITLRESVYGNGEYFLFQLDVVGLFIFEE